MTATKSRLLFQLLLATQLLIAKPVLAHFPWLSMNQQGKVELFFGEHPADRTYHMPDAVAQARVHVLGAAPTELKLAAVETDDYVGMRSKAKVVPSATVRSQITYGVHRGTRLEYYVVHRGGHLPHSIDGYKDEAPLKLDARVVDTEDGVDVYVLWNGKPQADVATTLLCEDGHKEGEGKTDGRGKVSFNNQQVEDGLNGIMLGHTEKGKKGEFNGEAYEAVAHYLTVTFFDPEESDGRSSDSGADQGAVAAKVGSGRLHRPLKEPLTSFGAAVVGEHLYVFSGHDGASHGFGADALANHFRRIKFDDPLAQWEELPMHEPAQSTALVTDGKHLYRVGGLSFLNRGDEETNFKSTTHFARYDTAKRQWTDLAPLPAPRSSLDAAVLDNAIYVAGGWNLQGSSSSDAPWHEDILRFDLDQPEQGWVSLPGPGYVTRAASLAAHDGKLYLFGGIQQRGITRKVSVFDPKTTEWSEGPELKADSRSSGFATSSFATGGRLYVTGGSGILYRLNDAGDNWEITDSLLYPRMFLRLLPASSTRLLALGGTSGLGGRIAVVESIDLAGEPARFKTVGWSVAFKGRAKHSQVLVPLGRKLYAFGGNASRNPHDFSQEAFVDEAFAFDIADQSVEDLPALPHAMQSGAGVVYSQTSEHRKIVVAGGLGPVGDTFGALNNISWFDPDSKEWSVAPAKLPQPRSMFSGVAHDDALWFFAGADAGVQGGGHTPSVLHWWGDETPASELPNVNVPTPRRSFGAAMAGSQYYLVGGLTEGSNIAKNVDVFNFEDRTWRQVSAPQVPRVFPSLAEVNGKLYLYGGFARKEGHFAPATSLEVYDPEGDAWTTIADAIPGVEPSMSMMGMSGRLLFYGIDRQADRRANFVLAIPDALASPGEVEGMSFGSSRSGGRDVAANAKALMRKDVDKDGRLTREELGARLASLMDEGDKDNSGALTYSELRTALEARE